MSLNSQYSSSELKQATENFSDSLKIGEGGFGCVYKGSLRRTTVAIKKLHFNSLQGLPQFQQEIDVLTKVRHPHLVNLIGSCSEISALVYEFLPNGSLEDRLVCANNTPSLTWQARTRIVSEICLALVFLRESKPHFVIHGDLKPDNILLDANFICKLSDFGLSRIIKLSDTEITSGYHTSHPVGTFAYMDPEYLENGELRRKSDVYSFGIIVLRLLTGKPPWNIASVVKKAMRNGGVHTIIDESAGRWPSEIAKQLAQLGLNCDKSRSRPTMIRVWDKIEPLVKIGSQPPELSSNGSIFNEDCIPSFFICPISQRVVANENFFKLADLDNDGVISELEALAFFRRFDLPDDVPAKIWYNVGVSGTLSRHGFYKALRLVTIAQRHRALTESLIYSALHGPEAAEIPPPEMTPMEPQPPTQPHGSSPRYPESDPNFQREQHLESYDRLKQEQDGLKQALGRLKQERDGLKQEQDRLKQELDRLKQAHDDAIKVAEGLWNERERTICSNMSLNYQYSSTELEQATENFSDSLKIGEGGFGCVYKGLLRKTIVAIKKLHFNSLQGLPQFQQEIDVLTKVRHPHLVNLIGSSSKIPALVYEFLPNGSLEDRLVCANNTPSLTWQARTRIVSEICLALVFLRESKPHFVIHGDLKPDNILLDANFICKLSDFGLSRIIKLSDTEITSGYHASHPVGTFAYMDPEYLENGELRRKSDVYLFGIIVLRLLTGKPPWNIASEVNEAFENGGLQTIIDTSAGQWPFEIAEQLALLGLSCVKSRNRPNMLHVWDKIEPLVKIGSQSPELSSNGSIFKEDCIPSFFICPISQEIMEDPHVAADRFTYEAKGIKRWLYTGHNTSPMTNLVLPSRDLIPNHVLRSAIKDWLEKHVRL